MIPALYIAVVGTRENKYIRQIRKQLRELERQIHVYTALMPNLQVNEKPKMDVSDESKTDLDNAGDKRKDPAQFLVFE